MISENSDIAFVPYKVAENTINETNNNKVDRGEENNKEPLELENSDEKISIKAPDTGKYSNNTQKTSWQPLFLTVFIGILWGIVWILRKNLKKSKKV